MARGCAGGGDGVAGAVGAASGACPAHRRSGHGGHLGDRAAHRRGGAVYGAPSGHQRPRDRGRVGGGTGGRFERTGRLGGGRPAAGVGGPWLAPAGFPVVGMFPGRTHCPSRYRRGGGDAGAAQAAPGRSGGVVAGAGRHGRERGRGDPGTRFGSAGGGGPGRHAGPRVFPAGRGAVVQRGGVSHRGQHTRRHRVCGGRICPPRGGAAAGRRGWLSPAGLAPGGPGGAVLAAWGAGGRGGAGRVRRHAARP
jgi:hypothetical protein